MSQKKQKLRTAGDVISRLRWSSFSNEQENTSTATVVFGYLDGIHGYLEKNVLDYVPIDSGGDIPEHRIIYFRRVDDLEDPSKQILWDRNGRYDRLFKYSGSGTCVSEQTMQAVKEAQENMARLEREKLERREEKARRRARNAQRRRRQFDASDITKSPANDISHQRFEWSAAPWFVFSPKHSEWIDANKTTREEKDCNKPQEKKEEIVVVTWNVLFDLFDDGILEQEAETIEERWKALCSILESSNADVISLQEVTPSFLGVLCQTKWARQEYAISAAPGGTKDSTVTPSGVMILWHKASMATLSREFALFQCIDCNRNRSLVVSLLHRSNMIRSDSATVYLFGAAHLPADKATSNPGTKDSRKLARKRELSAILGQFERLRKKIMQSQITVKAVTPIVAGDFNCEDEELLNGLFSGKHHNTGDCALRFCDAWASLCPTLEGYTFDPETNPRAARSNALVGGTGRRRRIDRIFIGPCYSSNVSSTQKRVAPVDTKLLGKDGDSLPPSDHFGVQVVLKTLSTDASVQSQASMPCNIWAANSPSSLHYMVALILDSPKLEALKAKNDPQSSLPLLHMTLLHGFVEADHGCLDLAKLAVKEAIVSAGDSSVSNLTFSRDSLQVFEHRESCTLVALPENQSSCQEWLESLYGQLRVRFVSCSDQERHGDSGWTPHVTLGVAGSSTRARELEASWIQNGLWNLEGESLAIRSVDILKRGENGNFQSIASFSNVVSTHLPRRLDEFLSDSGAAASRYMEEQIRSVAFRVERACRTVASENGLVAKIHVTGSSQLQAALPGLSDVDAVLELKPINENQGALHYLLQQEGLNAFYRNVVKYLQNEINGVNARFRPAGGEWILTIRIPDQPSMDLSLCACDGDGRPVNDASREHLASIQDGKEILSVIRNAGGNALVEIFQGALRILKVWASRHDVYGAASGFLGGGGWAVSLARGVLDAVESGAITISGEDCSHGLVRFFFSSGVLLSDSPVTLCSSQCPTPARRAGTLSVLSPCSNGDFGSKTTKATTHAIQTEIRRSSAVLKQSTDLACILQVRSTFDFISEFAHVLVMEILATAGDMIPSSNIGAIKPGELKAWGNNQFLNLLVTLERKTGNASCLRPKAPPLRIGREWNIESPSLQCGFCWVIGLKSNDSLIRPLVPQLESDVRKGFSTHVGEENAKILRYNVRVLTNAEAKEVAVKVASEL